MRLGDVVTLDREQIAGQLLPYIGMEDIESGTGALLSDVSERTVKSATFSFSQEHVLYGRLRPYLNKVVCPDFAGHCSTEIIPFRPSSRLDRQFLAFYMRSAAFVEAANRTTTGSRMPRAQLEDLLNLEIPLPSLDEQRRIVKVLDEATNSISALKQNRQAKIEAFNAYVDLVADEMLRASGESIGVRGNLDAAAHDSMTVGQDLSSLDELVESAPARLPLIALTTLFADGDWIESKDQSPHGIRLIQTGNVRRGQFAERRDKARFVSVATFERLKCTEVLPGDCLISRLPDPVGRACIIPRTSDKMITAVDCTIVRFDESRILPSYFVWFTQSRAYEISIAAVTTGATRVRVSRKKLGEVLIPLPTLDEQRRIVKVLDEANEARQHAIDVCEKSLMEISVLQDSLMTKVLVGA